MKTIVTTLPLTDEQLDEYFDDIDQYYFGIDIDNSELEAKNILNYIYNSGMKCDLQISKYSDKLKQMLVHFITTDKFIHIPVLEDLWCAIIRYNLNKFSVNDTTLVTFIEDFFVENQDLIDELTNILFNLKFYLCNIKINEKETQDSLENKHFDKVKNNIVSLRHSNVFWLLMMDYDHKDLELFNYTNFNSLSFEGRKIYYYFYNEFNPFTVIDFIQDEENI